MRRVERVEAMRATWRRLHPFLFFDTAKTVALGALALVGGFSEAAILLAVVKAATMMAAGVDQEVINIGPFAPTMGVWTLLGLAVGLALLRIVIGVINARIAASLAAEAQRTITRQTFELFANSTWAMQRRWPAGDVQALVASQVPKATNAVLQVSVGLVAFMSFAVLLGSSVLLSWGVSLALLVLVGLLFVLLRPLAKRGRKANTGVARTNLARANAIVEAMDLTREAQLFGSEQSLQDSINKTIDANADAYRQGVQVDKLQPAIYQGAALLFLVMGMAGAYAFAPDDVADLAVVILLLVRATTYGNTVQSTYQKVNNLLPFWETVLKAQEEFRRHARVLGSTELASIDLLEVRNGSFGYLPDEPILHDLDFTIRRGETVGIVGPSGAGKTSLVQVLLRLHDLDSGEYLVNGIPPADYDPGAWTRRVTMVPQDAKLLTGTAAENIRFFRDGLDDATVERAAKLAHIDEDIRALRLGYDTPLGVSVGGLSGGQRQRICIARALAGSPEVVVLDEPTSALDMRSEKAIRDALAEMHGTLTLIIIAHRMSTLKMCDRIMVLEGGRITAFDSPELLMDDNDFYREAKNFSVTL